MIKVQNNIATREPLPSFLRGLSPETLLDLSFTDPALGVQDVQWLPEDDQTPELGENQVYDGTETLTVDTDRQVVVVVRGIRDMTPEEIEERWMADNPVPTTCTRRQGLLALLQSGIKRADIEAKIAAISDETQREAALIEYESATWERENPFLQQMWASLDGAPEQLDDLFRLAVTL